MIFSFTAHTFSPSPEGPTVDSCPSVPERFTMKSTIERLESRQYLSGAVQTPSTFFPIGVWLQPTSSFSKWKARGVNTLVGYESQGGSVSIDSWSNAVNNNGLYQIRQPRSNINKDREEKRLLAFLQPDEPEATGVSAQTVQKNYFSWKKSDSAKPIMTNFSGGNLLMGTTSVATYQQKYLPSSDWVGNDFYPTTGWDRPDWIDYSKANEHHTEGEAVTRFAQISNHKAQWAFIETSDQNLSWTPSDTPGVTPAQFRGELWDAIIHGARGVVYFPQAFNGFSYDATPAAVVTEMTKQNARIQGSVASVLNSAADPAADALQLKFTNGLHSNYLEGTVRNKAPDGKTYYFVLNMSSVALAGQRVDLAGLTAGNSIGVTGESRSVGAQSDALGSYVTDNFAPYELHIYAAAPATTVAAAAVATTGSTSSSNLVTTWGVTVTTAPTTYTLPASSLSTWLSGDASNTPAGTKALKDLLDCPN